MGYITRIFVMMALAATSCDDAPAQKENRMTASAPSTSAATIFARIGLPLPKGKVEFAEQMDGMDDAARVILVIPSSEWEKFSGRLPLSAPDQPPFDEEANSHLGPDEQGWQPSQAHGLETAQFPWKDGSESLNIGKAPAGQDGVRIFVFWHQL